MSIFGSMRLLQALSNGTINSADLTSLLDSDVGAKNDWFGLTIVRSQMDQLAWRPTALQAVIDSPTALQAVIDSPTALQAVIDSHTAMQAVIDSPTALAAVIDSPTAMAAVIDSPVAKMAFYNSDIALTACLESAAAHSALVNAATLYTKNANGTTFVDLTTGVLPSSLVSSGKYLVLGAYYSTSHSVTIKTRKDGSIMPNQTKLGATDVNHENSRLCCPVASPLQFNLSGSSAGANLTSLIFLRCDV